MNLKRFSKFIAIVLAICLVMPIFPVNVFAKDNNSDEAELISLTVTNSEGEKVPLLNTSNSIHLGKNIRLKQNSLMQMKSTVYIL